jgi:hypothetical protein
MITYPLARLIHWIVQKLGGWRELFRRMRARRRWGKQYSAQFNNLPKFVREDEQRELHPHTRLISASEVPTKYNQGLRRN